MRKLWPVIICFFAYTYAHAANDRAFAWQVDSDIATVYLLGSIHLADKSFYPLRQEIEDAFARSDNLVVELDINQIDAGAYGRLLSREGIYKDGTTIRDIVSEETWRQLLKHLEQLNIDYENIKHYRPGVLVMTISTMQAIQMGFDPELGIDAYFLRQAVRQSKEIIALETLEQQFNLFLNIADDELLIKETLYSLEESEAMMADMVRYWKLGDEAQMNKLLFEDAIEDYPSFSKIYDSLLYQRNRQMTSKIDAMLRQKTAEKTVYFVVVGSGHLIGDKGIVNSLKEKGYIVRRL